MSESNEAKLPDLQVSLIQAGLSWQNPAANRQRFAELMADLEGETDLIVLPEMFTTGFTMNAAEVAEPWAGGQAETVRWMQQQASDLDAAVCGSVAMQDEGRPVNRMIFATPEGELHTYDKRHLFRMANEHEHYQAGTERKVVAYRGWRILLQVCYDLRFPVFSRNRDDYELALYVANWPKPRRIAWRTLLKARAIENQAFVVGVNRVGQDGNNNPYSGDSMAVDFKGDLMIDHPVGADFVETVSLSMTGLRGFRDKFPAWRDADQFALLS